VEPVVCAGPGPVANGGSGLDAFLQAMNKLQLAQEYFEKNNPQSVELENVVSFICLVPNIVQVEITLEGTRKVVATIYDAWFSYNGAI
jgi:hypothetical protein